jgi:argininosuccinate lyase
VTLWSGRFAEGPSKILWDYTADKIDRRLLLDDIFGSLAQAKMLGHVGLVTTKESEMLVEGLRVIEADAVAGSFEFFDSDEDVHSAVERRLIELIGPLGGKLHTGRSRNDQIALDIRLYLGRMCDERIEQLRALATVMVNTAESVGETVIPSFTHLQQAQAIPLAHHLLAYAWMFLRDADRIGDASRRIKVSPLGAGASGGSSLPLDPEFSTKQLGWDTTFTNSIDAIASRDAVAEYTFACTQSMIHLSRLAEELVLWTTTEFGWATYGDDVTTGSSAMPQKKNPDIAELARGRGGKAIGELTTMLAIQKGLPMAYNRDLQEDKAAVFAVDDLLSGTIVAVGALVESAIFNPPEPSAWVCSLDLAEVLVERGVPFREAHEQVGVVIRALIEDGRDMSQTTLADLQMVDNRWVEADLGVLTAEASVRRRRSPGGGSFESVQHQISALRSTLS